MSVSFARAIADGLQRHGVPVIYHPGWERNGNGQTSRYDGGLFHHTGGPLDGGLSVLLNGRPDLPPPLCNSCGHANGAVRIVAAHPANHAGAAGGSWARPFPDTRIFNPLVWGHEIMYPGAAPMTQAQYRSALILAGVICGILGKPNPEWARLHYETSVTGKWDFGVGKGHGVWFSGTQFRRDIWPALMGEEDDLRDDERAALLQLRDMYIPEYQSEVVGDDGKQSPFRAHLPRYATIADARAWWMERNLGSLAEAVKRIEETLEALSLPKDQT